MGMVRGCYFPDDLLYHPEHKVWVRPEPDKTLTIGVTSLFCAEVGRVVHCTPKKSGKTVKRDQSCATIETETWVGPIRCPVEGEVVAANSDLLQAPELVNTDVYGAGWLVKVRPVDWDSECAVLSTGQSALAAFEEKMDSEGFTGC